MLTGRIVDAPAARAAGLVRSLHAPDELLPAAYALGARDQRQRGAGVGGDDASAAPAHARRRPRRSRTAPSRSGSRAAPLRRRGEGVAAFLEKRPPEFPGRVSTDADRPFRRLKLRQPRRLRRVDVDPPSDERGTELVELRQARFGCRLPGRRDGEHERFDDHERRAVAREEPGAPRPHSSVTATDAWSRRPSVSVMSTTGTSSVVGVLEEHAHVGLEPAVGEHDDRVVRRKRQELVGERCSGVDERAARLPDPLRDELTVLGETGGRTDAAPDHPVGIREYADRGLECLGRDIASQAFDRGDVVADRGREELVARASARASGAAARGSGGSSPYVARARRSSARPL